MNRFLQFFNLFGVVALSVLCGMQWRGNSIVNAESIRFEKQTFDQAAIITQQTKTLKENGTDLEEYRQRTAAADAALNNLQLNTISLTTERDQLKVLQKQLTNEIASREAALKQQDNIIHQLETERDNAISKFNDLAVKYNAAVKTAK